MKVYERSVNGHREDGTTVVVSQANGLAEIDECRNGHKNVLRISGINSTDYHIVYRNGDVVTLTLVDTPAESEQQAEPIGFGDVNIGDRLVFATRDNGFGGTGDLIDRTGVVTSATEKTVTVELDNPTPIRAFEGGKARTYGLTARLRAAHWYGRSVRRLAKAVATPTTPERRMISKRLNAGYYKIHTPLGTWTVEHTRYDQDEKRAGLRDKWVLLYPGEQVPDGEADTKAELMTRIEDILAHELEAKSHALAEACAEAYRTEKHEDESPWLPASQLFFELSRAT